MTVPNYDRYLQTRRFGSLDGVRFLCIAAVLWHHAPLSHELQLLQRGFVGVDFFFVISGFLITTLLLREQRVNGSISLRQFYRRRILRIVPIYFLVVTFVCVFYVVIKGQTELLRLVPFYYLFLSNYLTEQIPTLGITWSLSVEEQYYILWPLMLILTPRRWMAWVLASLITLNVLAVTGTLRPFGVHPFQVGVLQFKMFTATFAPILLGSAAAMILDTPRGFSYLSRTLGARWIALPLFLAIPVLLQTLPANVTGLPNLVLHLTMTAALISVVIREDHVMQPFLTLSPIQRIGQISYGIYLYHLLALHVTHSLGVTGPYTILFVYSALSILVAEVSFRTFEAWFLRLRESPTKRVSPDPYRL